MKALTRYILSFISLISFIILSGFYYLTLENNDESQLYRQAESFFNTSDIFHSLQYDIETDDFEISKCSMSKCFNLSQCLLQKEFKVFVHPTSNVSGISVVYSNILKVLRESSFYTQDYRLACIFILGIDTIDRDGRSENFVKHVNDLVHSLPSELWNEGRNHIIFNLYHGTFPDYSDHDLGFDVGYALIARASANAQVFRHGFDLSFPLFHQEHPLRTSVEAVWPLKLEDRHLVSFKGKRYVYGIGSETRDSLYHLHNGKSSVMVTTCKHNNDWKKYEDQRCEQDNIEFEKWDYDEVMSNSTFCLTPRGRRLGSFRFLEALKLGCIPVVLSDDWVLPFAEVIDWSQAAVIAHEDSVLTITDVLNAIPFHRVLHMKQQARGLYQRYFSSVEKIVTTSIEILKERINKQRGLPARQWNAETYGVFALNMMNSHDKEGCSIILQATAKVSGRLTRHINLLSNLPFVYKILIFWPSSRGIPPDGGLTSSGKTISFIVVPSTNQSAMFSVAYSHYEEMEGDFLLLLDERVNLSKEEVINIYNIAKTEPERLTGTYAAFHKMVQGSWIVDFHPSVERSIVLPHLLIFKRILLLHLWQWIPNPAKTIAERIPQCYTLLLNFMMTERHFRPPVFVTSRTSEQWVPNRNYSLCLNEERAQKVDMDDQILLAIIDTRSETGPTGKNAVALRQQLVVACNEIQKKFFFDSTAFLKYHLRY